VTPELEMSGALYYVDELGAQAIDAYERFDLGLTWAPTKQVELALWGQNLLEEEHAEASAVAIPRGVQFTARLGF
jgi:outer membrane receptor protein involved in Fe transport